MRSGQRAWWISGSAAAALVFSGTSADASPATTHLAQAEPVDKGLPTWLFLPTVAAVLLLFASLVTAIVLVVRHLTRHSRPPKQSDPVATRRRLVRWVSGSLATILVLCGGGLVFQKWYTGMRSSQEREKDKKWFAEQQHLASWLDASSVLTAQSAALLAGNEQAFLATVDPGQPQLRAEYKRMYDSLRALGVTGWTYFTDYPPLENFAHTDIKADVTVSYCLLVLECSQQDPKDDGLFHDLATVKQSLTLDKRDGAYKIVSAAQTGKDRPPWQSTDLAFATGQRVVVAAAPSQRGRLQQVTATADKAALEADKFARYTGVKPAKYHLYLAGNEEWKSSWYGGDKSSYASGYARATGVVGMDVVLDMSKMDSQSTLAETLRHEFGHVVTLQGVQAGGDLIFDASSWLKEGVADYIGILPRDRVDAGRVSPLRGAAIPKDLRIEPLDDDASRADADRLYGYGYLAVKCMADTYGETKMMTYVNAVLRQHKASDAAARQAFGVSYEKLNSTCLRYFRTAVG